MVAHVNVTAILPFVVCFLKALMGDNEKAMLWCTRALESQVTLCTAPVRYLQAIACATHSVVSACAETLWSASPRLHICFSKGSAWCSHLLALLGSDPPVRRSVQERSPNPLLSPLFYSAQPLFRRLHLHPRRALTLLLPLPLPPPAVCGVLEGCLCIAHVSLWRKTWGETIRPGVVPGLFPCSRLAFQRCRSDVALEGPALDRLIAAMQECELVVLDEVRMCSGSLQPARRHPSYRRKAGYRF